MQKLAAFLYTNSEISEREYKRKALLKSHQKILRSKLNQGDKRSKMFLKEIEDKKKWKISCVHRLEEFIILKCP